MRDILFKAKRKDNGEWAEGYYWNNHLLDKHYIINVKDGATYTVKQTEIDPDTLCQYTEEDDGEEGIWEQDIYSITRKGETYDCVVKFLDGCFWFAPIGNYDDAMTLHDAFVNGFCCFKLGNTVDNPELLESEV